MKLSWGGRAGEPLGVDADVPAGPELLALTPEYDAGQHSTYAESLTRALADDTVHNIALTGRYGVGKSSVLAEFARTHGGRVLSLSLSTLGPDDSGETATNRIEKELVKQLLHSRPPRDLPRSRYRRIESLSRARAVSVSALQLVVVCGLLWFFDVFPRVKIASGGHGWPLRIGAAALFAGMVIAALTYLRLAVHNRVVASVSAAGASISLTSKEDSYFDKYLDEIVYYFECTSVDVVVFEDLDRFDDPGIFEALRELNSLLNAAGAVRGRSIRFVYALKDSIFEQLGNDIPAAGDDAAMAESVRANRTKFFDLVVPMVPFITHRNARDLMVQVMGDKSLVPVSPKVIDLVARHLTDMRLLKNIRNEYAVFAARLITAEHGISNLRPDAVFAMMVYKNVHLADFERIQLGRSDLDAVYRLSRQLVAESIAARRLRIRQIRIGEALTEAIDAKSAAYSERLTWYAESIAKRAIQRHGQAIYLVGDERFAADKLGPAFWQSLLGSDHDVRVLYSAYQQQQTITITRDELWALLGEDLRVGDWDTRERKEIAEERSTLTDDVNLLRTAGFEELAARPDFTVRCGDHDLNFDRVLATELKSEVARDLVSHGYIDQNFALYVAQYYVDRVSAAAMNFILQHVQTNKPDPNYNFPGTGDIDSVLRETRANFLDQRSAYNIQLLDHLLADANAGRAGEVLGRLIRIDGPAERAFLGLSFGAGQRAADAVAWMTPSWARVFVCLVELPDLDDERRAALVSAALEHAWSRKDYQLSEAVRTYLQVTYRHFRCLTEAAEEPAALNAVLLLGRADVVVDELSALDQHVQTLVVRRGNYSLTAENLRAALGGPDTLSLDVIREIDPEVFGHCIAQPDKYLTAVCSEERKSVTVLDPATFVEMVAAMGDWSRKEVIEACQLAADACRVDDLADVPESVWPGVVAARRCPATFANVVRYVEVAQGVDKDLARLLIDAGEISSVTEADEARRLQLAKVILNSSATIPVPLTRVRLVRSLDLRSQISPADLTPEDGNLLGLLIKNQLCADSPELFERFRASDWGSLRFGIQCSKNFAVFVSPELLDEDTVARLLSSPKVNPAVKNAVLARLDEFVPSDHRAALRYAAQHAATSGQSLNAGQLERIARVTKDASSLVRLLDQLGDTIDSESAMDVLAALGAPYSELNTAGAKFTVPRDQHHLAVFGRLRAAGRLTMATRPAKLGITVGSPHSSESQRPPDDSGTA